MKKIINEQFDKETVEEYYIHQNLSYDNVAKALGISQMQVRRLCKKYDLKKDIKTWKQSAVITNLQKYGVENPFANDEVKQKIVSTNQKKVWD